MSELGDCSDPKICTERDISLKYPTCPSTRNWSMPPYHSIQLSSRVRRSSTTLKYASISGCLVVSEESIAAQRESCGVELGASLLRIAASHYRTNHGTAPSRSAAANLCYSTLLEQVEQGDVRISSMGSVIAGGFVFYTTISKLSCAMQNSPPDSTLSSQYNPAQSPRARRYRLAPSGCPQSLVSMSQRRTLPG
jgi:hypothetical protein